MSAILGDGLRLAGLGVVAGVAGSIAAARVLRGMVAGVSAIDPITVSLSALVLVIVAAAACFAAARRAGAVDPVITLAAE